MTVFTRFITVMFITIIIWLIIVVPIVLTKVIYEIWKNFNLQKYDCYKCKHCKAIRNPSSTTVPYFCEYEHKFIEGFVKCKDFEEGKQKNHLYY